LYPSEDSNEIMKTKLIVLAGVLALGASLQAATSYTLDFSQQNSNGLTIDPSGNWAVSPYSGIIGGTYSGSTYVSGGTSVKLYCDDFTDEVTYGAQDLPVYITALTATGATLQDDTRYGDKNANSTYPAGTALYEEMAWLATQMQTSGISTDNDIAIQEAIWKLTYDTGDTTADPSNSAGYTGTVSNGVTGSTNSTAQSDTTWIADAQAYVAGFNGTSSTWSHASSYTNLVTADWYIVTATDAAGCTLGATGTTGCTPGGSGAATDDTQEFLAYYTGGGLPVTTQTASATPEPASFILIGSGLLVGGIFGRRRAKKNS